MVEFLSFREDDATQEPTVTVEAFTGQSNSTAVRIEAGEDVAFDPHAAPAVEAAE